MNERIQELAKQAYRQDCLESNPLWEEGVAFKRFMGLMDGTFEKFAELIVRECMSMCDKVHSDYGMASDTARISKRYIKEHFGVEE